MNFESTDCEMKEYAVQLEKKEEAIFGNGTYAELSGDETHIIVWSDGETYKIPYTENVYKLIQNLANS